VSDLRVKRGDSIPLTVGPILQADGDVQDITGYTITFTAKDRLSDADGAAIITQGGTITDGPAGLGLVTIPPASTSGFTTDRALHWDVQIRDPAGATKTVDSGKLIVERDVTRA
jgi:hypothetical protein